MADLIVINKADGNLLPLAQQAKSEYLSALKLLGRRSNEKDTSCVFLVSSKENLGFPEVLSCIVHFLRMKISTGDLYQRRHLQRMKSFDQISKSIILRK